MAREKHKQEQAVEELKAESARILEAIKTGDPDQASQNLKFLLDLNLISEQRAQRIHTYITTRAGSEGVTIQKSTQPALQPPEEPPEAPGRLFEPPQPWFQSGERINPSIPLIAGASRWAPSTEVQTLAHAQKKMTPSTIPGQTGLAPDGAVTTNFDQFGAKATGLYEIVEGALMERWVSNWIGAGHSQSEVCREALQSRLRHFPTAQVADTDEQFRLGADKRQYRYTCIFRLQTTTAPAHQP